MLTVAGIQLACGADREENFGRALDLARIAVERGARIVCFAECFAWPWFPRKAVEENRKLAEPIPGPLTRSLQLLAEQTQAVLIAPVFESGDDAAQYNTSVVIDADGAILGIYRKNHIPDLPNYQERFYFRPGNLGFPVFRTRYATIGVQTCWDNFFPEGARALALKGAQIIFCPTACSTPTGVSKWERAIVGHAVYNSLFAFRVNRVGTEGSMTFYGKSFCVDPNGDFVTEPAGADEGVVLADVDLDRIKLVRDDWTFFPDRRPGIYKDLV
ncbi:MAG: nitrilase-related carbon-nitrogen hydrolase [candidate division NC10 bacterium]